MSTMYVNKIQELNVGSGITIPSNVRASGHVIQMTESGTFSDSIQTSSGAWLDTELFVDIAPKFSNSKIVVIGSPVILLAGTGTIMRGSIRVIRTIGGAGATNVFNTADFVEQFQVRNASNEHTTIGSIVLTDTPNTTSYVRYRAQIYYYGDSGTTQFRLWGSARGSKLIAQEIAV